MLNQLFYAEQGWLNGTVDTILEISARLFTMSLDCIHRSRIREVSRMLSNFIWNIMKSTTFRSLSMDFVSPFGAYILAGYTHEH